MLVVDQWGRIDTTKECFRKRGLDVRQARRMVEVCKGNAWDVARGMNPDLKEMPQLWVATAI